MGSFSLWHWVVVIVVVMLLFGRGRISDIMGEFGRGLKGFRQGINDEQDEALSRFAEERKARDGANAAGKPDRPI